MKLFFFLVCLICLCSTVLIAHPVLAKEEKTEILIGSHLPLTGGLAMAGAEQKWAYERAVEDVNKTGGIYVVEYGRKLPVRLIVMDDETNPGMAAAVVERLIKRTHVDLLLSGCTGAHGVIPGMITAEKNRTYYHGAVLWVSDFLKHNFKWCTMYFFDMAQGGSLGFEVWDSLHEDQRPQKPAIFEEDTFDGKQLGDLWIALAEKYGYRITLRESMGMMVGAKDFTSQIIRAKAAGVDAILLMANTTDTVTLIRQMKQNKFSVKFFHGWKGTWETEFYQALGKDADYIFCDGFWSEDYPFKGAKELGKHYFDEFGKRSVGIGLYYALCQVLWQAIAKAGTLDGEKIRRAVLDNMFKTVNGTVNYDKRGIALFPLAEFQWWKGKQQIVYPVEYSQLQAMPAPPWDER
jgi:branched-chain amino acid transport system substrate-binding protein